jgi:hypothetical protein
VCISERSFEQILGKKLGNYGMPSKNLFSKLNLRIKEKEID